MRKRRLSKALAMFLAAALTIPAAVPVAASESTADKEETVYVKTDANREEKTVIVSDWLAELMKQRCRFQRYRRCFTDL